jgi:hypothetical protein
LCSKPYLSFPSPQHHVGKLYPGKEFLLREGRRVVAKGRVLEILALEESAKKRLEAGQDLGNRPPSYPNLMLLVN